MAFPQLSSVLPYRDYDEESGMFIRANTMGFMLEAQPLIGANPQIVMTLENLLRTKLPRNFPLSFHMVSSKRVGQQIANGLKRLRHGRASSLKNSMLSPAPIIYVPQKRFFSS